MTWPAYADYAARTFCCCCCCCCWLVEELPKKDKNKLVSWIFDPSKEIANSLHSWWNFIAVLVNYKLNTFLHYVTSGGRVANQRKGAHAHCSVILLVRIRHRLWIEHRRLIYTGLASTKGKYIHKVQSEEDLCTTMSIVLNSNWGTFSPVFMNIYWRSALTLCKSVFSPSIQRLRPIQNRTIKILSS